MKENKRSFLNQAIIILPLIILGINVLLHKLLPDKQNTIKDTGYYIVFLGIAFIYLVLIITPRLKELARSRIFHLAPLLSVVFVLVAVWDTLTLKLNVFHLPFFPSTERVIYALIVDWKTLSISILFSLRLMSLGFILGTVAGVATGILIGWSRRGNYWLGPAIKILGPIPATTWIPIAMLVFPSSFYASLFLVVLAVWFPVTVLTSSGIANVSNSYYEVAKTLGASNRYMIFHIAIPAASPMIFISLYAGLGTAFATLLAAEMLGAKAGLGWYIAWHQGWAEFAKVYAALFIIAILASALIYLLFKTKDRLLVWQKGLIKW